MHGQHIAQCIIVLAFAATLWRLAKRLPLQNVLAAAGTILCLSTLLEMLNQKTGLPFGKFVYTEHSGVPVFRLVPWPMPLLWVVILVNARRLARLIFPAKRHTANHGITVLVVSALLSAFFHACLEPLAFRCKWWIWKTDEAGFWHHVPPLNFIGLSLASLFILIAAFPWLIDKKSWSEPGCESMHG